ncbi:hypothetical protein GCM10010435_13940 [Winogradskya consettensis]|uniref:Uncharacterized protein n=1 Tax=Winogradskya consettensis TaxID=113560 RepID=A0A919SBX1_9ACTN|nr:hypothetical protein [Actinoplanes consettensis]GIM68990.1 hypothetical protein Aco04nite_13210 [Actinoplanes consettensis]
MTTRDRDYQQMMTALGDVARRRSTELDNAEQAYQTSAAQAAGELARAESDAAAAERWAGAAASQVLDVDREADRLWAQLRAGVRTRALGDLPEPEPVDALPRAALTQGPAPAQRRSARTLLASAAHRIEVTARPRERHRMPRWTLTLLPLVGALVAGMTALLAAGLVTFGRRDVPGGSAVQLLGWLAFLVAPSAGLPAAALYVHHRLHSRLDLGGVGLTLLGGMLAATVLALTFATS